MDEGMEPEVVRCSECNTELSEGQDRETTEDAVFCRPCFNNLTAQLHQVVAEQSQEINYPMAVRWTPGGGHGGVRFRSATESIPLWHQRLRQVIILRRDLFEVLPKIQDVKGVVVYVDPTYLRETRGGAEYVHEFQDDTGTIFETEDDHARLAREVGRFEHARVVVSYYDHPRLGRLYEGWTKRNMSRQKNLHVQNLHVQNRRGAGPCVAPEVLVLNGPSYVT